MYVTHIGEFLYRVLYIYWYFLFIIFWYFSLFNQSKFWRRPRGYRVRDFVVFTHIKYLFYLLPPLVLSLSISFFVVYNTQQPNNQEDQIMVGFFIFTLSRILWSVKIHINQSHPQTLQKGSRSASNFKSLFLLTKKCLCRLCHLLPQLFFHQSTSLPLNIFAMSNATFAKLFLRYINNHSSLLSYFLFLNSSFSWSIWGFYFSLFLSCVFIGLRSLHKLVQFCLVSL